MRPGPGLLSEAMCEEETVVSQWPSLPPSPPPTPFPGTPRVLFPANHYHPVSARPSHGQFYCRLCECSTCVCALLPGSAAARAIAVAKSACPPVAEATPPPPSPPLRAAALVELMVVGRDLPWSRHGLGLLAPLALALFGRRTHAQPHLHPWAHVDEGNYRRKAGPQMAKPGPNS